MRDVVLRFQVTKYAASGIFFIGGLKLRTDEAKEALSNIKSVVSLPP